MSKNQLEQICEASEFIKKIFGEIPNEYRDEKDDKDIPLTDVSADKRLIAVSLKLVKTKYCLDNVVKILKKVLKLWENTTELPEGVKKGKPPAVTPGCIKITQFFEMGEEAKPSGMLEWIFDEKKHLMSTLTFNGETVSEPDIEYISANQANELRMPKKVWFTFSNATEQLIRRVNAFLQAHPCLEQQPYRLESFPNVELQEIKKVSALAIPSHRSIINKESFGEQQQDSEKGRATFVFQGEDKDDMECDEDPIDVDDSKGDSYDESNIGNNIGLCAFAETAINSLHQAAKRGDVDAIRRLLVETNTNVEAKIDKYGSTPLHYAANNGQVDAMQYLVEKANANVEAKNDKYGSTPLHYAANNGQVDAMQYLVEKANANVEAKNKNGYTPLHIAAKNGNFNAVRYLVVKANANVKTKSYRGATPLSSARKRAVKDYLKESIRARKEMPQQVEVERKSAAEKGNTDMTHRLEEPDITNIVDKISIQRKLLSSQTTPVRTNFQKAEKILYEGAVRRPSKAKVLPIRAKLGREDLLKLPVTVLIDTILEGYCSVSIFSSRCESVC